MRPQPHKMVPVQVWVDIDEGIAELVARLHTIPGVRTQSSCEGTPTCPGYVMVYWQTPEAYEWLAKNYQLDPIEEWEQHAPVTVDHPAAYLRL